MCGNIASKESKDCLLKKVILTIYLETFLVEDQTSSSSTRPSKKNGELTHTLTADFLIVGQDNIDRCMEYVKSIMAQVAVLEIQSQLSG